VGSGRISASAGATSQPDATESFNVSEFCSADSPIVKPQWAHPLLSTKKKTRLELKALQEFAYDYYLRFLPFFKDQPEGTILPGVVVEFTKKMRQKLGLALLFEHKIRLNEHYFAEDPRLLPYTLFHEMTHIWLYNCLLDPGHTRRFYNKMTEFESTGLPIDPSVHIHGRMSPEAKFVYKCPNCLNRWYLRDKLSGKIFCGHCFDREKNEYYPHLIHQTCKFAG
jgi:hypothetical protein